MIGYLITFIVTAITFYNIGKIKAVYTLFNYYYSENELFQKLYNEFKSVFKD